MEHYIIIQALPGIAGGARVCICSILYISLLIIQYSPLMHITTAVVYACA